MTRGVKVAFVFTRFTFAGFLGGNGGLGGGGGASFTMTGGVNATSSFVRSLTAAGGGGGGGGDGGGGTGTASTAGGGGGGTGLDVFVFCAESWMEIIHTANASIVFFIYRFFTVMQTAGYSTKRIPTKGFFLC